MIISFSSCVDSAVCLDVSRTVTRYFRYCARTIMSSGIWNSRITYCFSFLLNFLYWSLTYLWLAVVPKTAPKSSNSPLKFRIYDVYSGRLNIPTCPSRPWWPLLPTRPHRRCPWPPLLVFDFLIFLWAWVVVVSPSPPLVPAAGGAVSVSGSMTFHF